MAFVAASSWLKLIVPVLGKVTFVVFMASVPVPRKDRFALSLKVIMLLKVPAAYPISKVVPVFTRMEEEPIELALNTWTRPLFIVMELKVLAGVVERVIINSPVVESAVPVI